MLIHWGYLYTPIYSIIYSKSTLLSIGERALKLSGSVIYYVISCGPVSHSACCRQLACRCPLTEPANGGPASRGKKTSIERRRPATGGGGGICYERQGEGRIDAAWADRAGPRGVRILSIPIHDVSCTSAGTTSCPTTRF